MIKIGLRARVTLGFGIGALLVSTAVALLSYQLTEKFLLQERERGAIRATYLEAAIVRSGLDADKPDITAALGALDTGGKRRAVLHRAGTWYGRNADFGARSTIPLDLQAMVEGGQPGAQRVRTDTGPALVVGIRLDDATSFYVVDSMQELHRSLQGLALIIALVAAATTAAGAWLGAYAARYVVRPMNSVVKAAREISKGDFATRIDPATEPDLAQLAASFNEMVDQLSARMERDRRFAADVSHELRSPLQTLSAAASVLSRHGPDMPQRAATAARLLSDEVGRFQALVTDLLELAQGDRPAATEPTDIAELAREICRRQGETMSKVDIEPGTPVVWEVDRRRFQQALTNLIANADKHGGGLSRIGIGQAGNGFCYVDVDDEGPGVSAPDSAIIFGRFVRGRAASARGDTDGTGLGLALVQQHIQAHGGTVAVLARPGGGARFRIELPPETT
jgi:signal transduction histidine kinase